jgi:tetratricopeptide (TPR) repeat protein
MMRLSIAVSCAFLLAVSLSAQQQDSNTPAQQQQARQAAQKKTDQQKKPDQKKPSTAEENPFPEGKSEKAADQDQEQSGSAPANGQNEPAAPQPAASGQQKKHSTAEDNPFPESESEKAAHQAEPQPPASSGPSGGAQPDQDYSSSQTKLKGLDLSGANDSRIADGGGGTILSPELGRKDTKVGEFYLHSGDYKGAYDRFVEATKVDPGNAQAVFDLAEAARHLNNRPEAVRNYQLYLSAVPDGPRSKDARKALKDMGIQPNS